jgi:hypothetical protein
MRARSLLGGALFTCAALGGCAHVAPYEREHLARPGMDTKREKAPEEFLAHVQDAREGGGGRGESAGGGCGCN